jgi:short-subunit dehydrogenase
LLAQKKALTAEYRIDVRPLALDLATESFHTKILEATQDLDIGLVVPNAGMTEVGDFAKSSIGVNQRMIALNVAHPVTLAHSFIERLRARQRGGILFIASTFGYQGVPFFANYAATKSFVLNFGEALHFELKRFGIDVTTLSPGLTVTNMSKGLPIDFGKLPIFSQTPEAVARFGIYSLGKTASAVPGIVNNIFIFFNRITPRFFPVALFGNLIKRAFKKETAGNYLLTPVRPDIGRGRIP